MCVTIKQNIYIHTSSSINWQRERTIKKIYSNISNVEVQECTRGASIVTCCVRVTCKNSFLREEDDGIGNLKYVPRACVRKVKP